MTPEKRIEAFAKEFPCLHGAPGISPFDANALDAWAVGGAPSGEKHAARCVLGIWNRHEQWQCGKFDVFAAYTTWDDIHFAAFQKWANAPFFL